MIPHLFADETGFVISTELVLVATILGLGLIVGQATLREQVVTELSDVADAVSAIDQGFAYSEVSGHSASSSGTIFDDTSDFCDASDSGSQRNFANNGTCVIIDFGDDTVNGVVSPIARGDSN